MILKTYFNEIKNRLLLIVLFSMSILTVFVVNKEILMFVYLKQSLLIKNKTIDYFISTSSTEVLYAYIDTTLYTYIILLNFFLVLHFVVFIKPGLLYSEKKQLIVLQKILLYTYLFFILMFYKILFPIIWGVFFENFINVSELKYTLYFEPKLSEFISLFIKFLNFIYFFSILAITFFFFLIKLKNSLKFIKKNRKLLIYTSFMITIIFSPADIFYQIYIGIPFLNFLEILILINLWYKSYLIRQPIKTY